MTRRIYKYELESRTPGIQKILMPKGALILSVAVINNKLVVYAAVNTLAPDQVYEFHLYWTGDTIEGYPGKFIGTLIEDDNGTQLVWHIFLKEPEDGKAEPSSDAS